MRFGFMDHLPCAEWQSEVQRYHDILAQIELGDALGFDTAWLAEIHFFPNVSRLASPLTVLAAAAQRTQRIRLGTAVTLLPLHNPLKIAEEAATVDILRAGAWSLEWAEELYRGTSLLIMSLSKRVGNGLRRPLRSSARPGRASGCRTRGSTFACRTSRFFPGRCSSPTPRFASPPTARRLTPSPDA